MHLYSNSLSLSIHNDCFAVGSIDGQVRVFRFSDVIHDASIQQPVAPDIYPDGFGAVKSVALVGQSE